LQAEKLRIVCDMDSASGSSGGSKGGSGTRKRSGSKLFHKDKHQDSAAESQAKSIANVQQQQQYSSSRLAATQAEQQKKQLNKAERPAQRKSLLSRREQLKSYIKMMRSDLARAERELKTVESDLEKLGVYDDLGMDVVIPTVTVPALHSASSKTVVVARQNSGMSSSGMNDEDFGSSAASSGAAGGGKDNRSSRSRLSIRSLLSDRHHSSHRSKSAHPDPHRRDITSVMPLASILEAEQQSVPRVIRGCCDFLREGDGSRLDLEGLFRISPNQEALRFVIATFVESSTPCTLNDCDLCKDDPHIAAAVLKRYLSEYIGDALLSDEAYQCFSALGRKDGGLEGNLPKVRQIVEKVVQPVQRTVLHYLILFFRDVAAHSASNKMNSSNISLVFGPSLFHLQLSSNAYDSVAQSALQNDAVRVLIDHYDEIFGSSKNRHNKHRRSSTATKPQPQSSSSEASEAKTTAVPATVTVTASVAAPTTPTPAGKEPPKSPSGHFSRSMRRSRRKSGVPAQATVPATGEIAPAPVVTPPVSPAKNAFGRSHRRSGRGSFAPHTMPPASPEANMTGSRRLLSIVRADGTSPSRSLRVSTGLDSSTRSIDAPDESSSCTPRSSMGSSTVSSLSTRLSDLAE